jgi:hypothetical protein
VTHPTRWAWPKSSDGNQLNRSGILGNDLEIRRDIPPPTPQVAASLSPQQLADHRGKIALEVQTVLSAYFTPNEAEPIRAAQLAWWCDELQDWTQEQVVWALRKWNRTNPDKRPTPGHILAICKDTRGRKIAAELAKAKPPPDPERVPATPEQASAILAEYGFRVAKRMPLDDA